MSRLRFLAESNRRARFCRPLTKPLIQGTDFFVTAKIVIFIKITANFRIFLQQIAKFTIIRTSLPLLDVGISDFVGFLECGQVGIYIAIVLQYLGDSQIVVRDVIKQINIVSFRQLHQ